MEAKNAWSVSLTAASFRPKDRWGRKRSITERREHLLLRSKFCKKFEDAMDDDFNTADAISAIFELVKFANTNVTRTAQGSCRVV